MSIFRKKEPPEKPWPTKYSTLTADQIEETIYELYDIMSTVGLTQREMTAMARAVVALDDIMSVLRHPADLRRFGYD